MKSWATLIKIFLELFKDYCYDSKFFLCFWDSCRCSELIWKKKNLKIWKTFPKIFNFWNFICGSAAEISRGSILEGVRFKILDACHAAEKKLKNTSFSSYFHIVCLILFWDTRYALMFSSLQQSNGHHLPLSKLMEKFKFFQDVLFL